MILLELQERDYAGAGVSITKLMQKQARNKVYATLYFLINHLNGTCLAMKAVLSIDLQSFASSLLIINEFINSSWTESKHIIKILLLFRGTILFKGFKWDVSFGLFYH